MSATIIGTDAAPQGARRSPAITGRFDDLRPSDVIDDRVRRYAMLEFYESCLADALRPPEGSTSR